MLESWSMWQCPARADQMPVHVRWVNSKLIWRAVECMRLANSGQRDIIPKVTKMGIACQTCTRLASDGKILQRISRFVYLIDQLDLVLARQWGTESEIEDQLAKMLERPYVLMEEDTDIPDVSNILPEIIEQFAMLELPKAIEQVGVWLRLA